MLVEFLIQYINWAMAFTVSFVILIAGKTIFTNWLPKWYVVAPILLQILSAGAWALLILLVEPTSKLTLLFSEMGVRSLIISSILWLWMKGLQLLIKKREEEESKKIKA